MIYLDTCVVIYFVERHPAFYASARAAIRARADAPLAISALVQAECLVAPMRRGDVALERRFDALFRRMTVLGFADPVFLDAARLRARHALNLPDALHLACAQYHGCSAFWTNDERLSAAGGDFVKVLTP